MPYISPAFRVVAATAAVLTAVFLWMQVDEYGIGESPWLASILIIVAFLGVALAPQSGKSLPIPQRRDPEENAVTDEGAMVVQERFTIIHRYLRDFFRNCIPDGNSYAFASAMKPLLNDHADRTAVHAAYAVYLLSIAKRSPTGIRGTDAAELRRIAVAEVAGMLDRESRRMGQRGRPREHELNQEIAAKEIASLDAVYPDLVDAFRRRDKYPLDVLLRRLDEEFSGMRETPEARDHYYGIKIRQALGLAALPIEKLRSEVALRP